MVLRQLVMLDFRDARMHPRQRRLPTRAVAIVPATIRAILYGESGTTRLRSGRQVIRSLQMSFAAFPLVMFTSDTHKLGEMVNPTSLTLMTYVVTTGIAVRNACPRWETVGALAGQCAAAVVRAHVANRHRSRSL